MMKIDLKELMSDKSDEELKKYLDQSTRYETEAVEAAIAELEQRGHHLTDEEKAKIIKDSEPDPKEKHFTPFPDKQAHLKVNDEEAPLLYSKRAIRALSVLFSTVFGTIMMAMNIRRNKYKGGPQVILFGTLYTIAAFSLLISIKQNTGITLAVNLLGAELFNRVLWPKYIGNDTKFRKRNAWIPFFSGVFMIIIIAAILIKYDNY